MPELLIESGSTLVYYYLMTMENVGLILDLLLNLTLLVSLTIISDFVERRFPKTTGKGVALQGTLFGVVAVLGMLKPLNLGPGLIFDGRSVMISLCALYFGPVSVAISVVLTAAYRIYLGGPGMLTGLLVTLSSAIVGLAARRLQKPDEKIVSILRLYVFGIIVHVTMIALMFTMPDGIGLSVIRKIGIPVIVLYPFATILAGKILSDQVSARMAVASLRESEERFKLSMEAAGAGLWDLDVRSDIAYYDLTYYSILGYDANVYTGTGLAWRSRLHPDDLERTLAENQKCIDGVTDAIDVEYRMLAKDSSIRWIKATGKCITRDEHGKATRIVGTHIDITDRKEAEDQLRHSLEEKEVLLREMHHRVKNNLNVILSLLNLQSSTIKTPEQAIEAFHNSRDRIMAMSLVHEELYKSHDYVNVDMGDYLGELMANLEQGYASNDRIAMHIHVSGVSLSINASIPCGLIISELVSNAMKYAFPDGRSGAISLEMGKTEDGFISLTVSDNGIGLDRPFEDLSGNNSGSLGLTLVRLLTEQLGGSIVVSVENGTCYRFIFPENP